jgi:hypothetical protein
MNVFDIFFKKFAYKFDKGYPDINNTQDVLLLESLLSKVIDENFELIKEADADEAVEILKKELNLTDEDFIKQSSVRYKLLVPRSERYNYVEKITQIPGFIYDANLSGSSIGGLKYKDTTFLLKPSGAQGRASAGTENEDVVVNEINKYIAEGAKNVVFDAPNKDLTINNVKEAVTVGYDVAGGKKADIIVKANKDYPISIKKDNAGFWESSDTRYKSLVLTLAKKISDGDFAPELVFQPFVDKLGNKKEGINTMYNETTKTKVSGIIVTDLPSKEEESIIFGSDKAIIVYRSFSPNDFRLEGDTLYIEVSKIIENIADVEEFNLEPVLNIRHDSTRSSTGGLRATVQPKNKIYSDDKVTGNKIELSYNDIMS